MNPTELNQLFEKIYAELTWMQDDKVESRERIGPSMIQHFRELCDALETDNRHKVASMFLDALAYKDAWRRFTSHQYERMHYVFRNFCILDKGKDGWKRAMQLLEKHGIDTTPYECLFEEEPAENSL